MPCCVNSKSNGMLHQRGASNSKFLSTSSVGLLSSLVRLVSFSTFSLLLSIALFCHFFQTKPFPSFGDGVHPHAELLLSCPDKNPHASPNSSVMCPLQLLTI